MAAQRIWRRVDDLDCAYQGHGLAARLHGHDWLAWQERDGSWKANRDGQLISFPSWSELRQAAERGENPAPPPVPPHCRAPLAALQRALGAILRSSGCDEKGSLWATVPTGYAHSAQAMLLRANFPYRVILMEGP